MSFIARGLIVAIRLYQKLISPRLNRQCLFRPTCSEYTIQQLQQYGLAGLKDAYIQLRDCRGSFAIHANGNGRLEMVTSTGRVIPENRIAEYIVYQYREWLRNLSGSEEVFDASDTRKGG